MWSPSGAVRKGVLDTHACQLISTLFLLRWLSGPKRWHKPSPGCPSCLQPSPAVGRCCSPPWAPPHGHPSSLQASSHSSGFLLKLKGEVSAGRKDLFLCKMVFYFGFCTAGYFRQGGMRGSAVETRLQNEMLTASSPGSRSLSPVAASPARIPRNGVYSCPEMPCGEVWPKHQLPFTGGPRYQRKNYCPAAGRGMNPRQCVKIMWDLVNRHGLGMRHSQSRRIRHTACKTDNRWHESPLFSPSSSRRSYWWETCQHFPESQSLNKELLHFRDSEGKYFWSVSITVASPAAEDSPHLLHTVTSNQEET